MKSLKAAFAVFLLLFALIVLSSASVYADRFLIDLSICDWGLYRDFDAKWVDDDIYLPPVNIPSLPVHPPTCGWDRLKDLSEKSIHLPATVEEYFWGDNGNTEGVGGDWRGVSWWVTTVTLPAEMGGKRVFLDFESVHLRAEVFVNRKLAGYDVIGHTPFTVDVTDEVRAGAENEIAVRITDPVGNFNWNDRQVMKWGSHDIPACHGFGGITGKVFLRAVDPVYIDDIYVRNMPLIKEVDLNLTVKNLTGSESSGSFTIKIYPLGKPDEVIWKKRLRRRIDPLESQITFKAKAQKAKPWDIDNPDLYVADVVFESDDRTIRDSMTQRFGFRWFDIGEKDGDQRLYLNGRRIVLLGGMSWGFWPINGVYPTREMAERDISIAKKMGFNYINFHRAIGQPPVMDAADEMGFLCYEEPGGYSCENADKNAVLWRDWRREKLFRMVKRDRSHPSLIIYNLQNRTPKEVEDDDIRNMRAAHEMDPARIITYISGFWKIPPKEHPTKLFMKPNDFTEYYTGWYDMHNHTPSHGYTDNYYNNPRDYLRYNGNAEEIVFWGEDGGIYGPPRVQLIKEYYDTSDGPLGWQGRHFIEWYLAYDEFLTGSGFREFFPDVDAFTVSLGNTTLYYHGRIIENVRIGNLGDCYTINGWAAPHVSNQAEVADLYRNPVGDPEIISRYCNPLYVAVKLRDKVVPVGSAVTADFFLVNDKGLNGPHTLTVTLEHNGEKCGFEKTLKAKIKGNEDYGQLLVENVEIKLDENPGYYSVRAALHDRKGKIKAEGSDDIFTVDIRGAKIPTKGAVVDTSGAINRMLAKTLNFTLPRFTSETTDPDYIIIGPNTYRNANQIASVMDCVANGATAVVIADADRFAEFLTTADHMQAIEYRGSYRINKGNFIAGKHGLLSGLPQAQAFNWEYQAFYNLRGHNVHALRLKGGETVVAAVADRKKEVFTALSIIPFGRGKIILSTLSILPHLNSDTPQSVVAKRLFLNFLMYACTES